MGEPGWGNAQSPMNESIVHEEGTRGSETSKYPEEKKENSITLVVASEEVDVYKRQMHRYAHNADGSISIKVPGNNSLRPH